ncbi:Uncharacterised protein [Klebsiella oxytoca]|nr:Uncharacterised protein [Klebsiella oxytoca]
MCRARTVTGRAAFSLLSDVAVILRHPLAHFKESPSSRFRGIGSLTMGTVGSLFHGQLDPYPERLPCAQEWLTAAKCDDLLAFLKDVIDRIDDIVHQDAQHIVAVLVPSAAPRLMEKRFGDWRLVADEYGHDNWLDSKDGERLDQVLDGILVREARFCPVLLTLVNESREEIEAAGVMTDLLRFPREPVRR